MNKLINNYMRRANMAYNNNNDGKFKKQSLGINLETSLFTGGSEVGGMGFSTFGGRFQISFWKAGASGHSRDLNNRIGVDFLQALQLDAWLTALMAKRAAEFAAGGASAYTPFEPVVYSIDSPVNGQMKNFGALSFSTVEIDGINRIKMVHSIDGDVKNEFIFLHTRNQNILTCDTGTLPVTYPIDNAEVTINGLQVFLKSWIDSQWNIGAATKLFFKRSGGGGNYNHGGNNNGGGNQRDGGDSEGYSNPVYGGGQDDNLPY